MSRCVCRVGLKWATRTQWAGGGGGGKREEKFLGSSLVKREKPRLVVRIKRPREKTKTKATQTKKGAERSAAWDAAQQTQARGEVEGPVTPGRARAAHSGLCRPRRAGAAAGLPAAGTPSRRRRPLVRAALQPCQVGNSGPGRQRPQQTLGEGSRCRRPRRVPWLPSALTGAEGGGSHLRLWPERGTWGVDRLRPRNK